MVADRLTRASKMLEQPTMLAGSLAFATTNSY